MRTYRQVTDFEPKVAELLARHAERLIAPTPPRGLWVCEEDGEPIIVLTVYTEPRIRISAIIDNPETKPFNSLARLAECFEEWAKSVGILSYCVVIARGDDHYCKIIERRGGLVLAEDGPWIEYLHEIDQTRDTRDGTRLWRPSDWRSLRTRVMDQLRALAKLGGDMRPTRTNVESLIRSGMRGATKGDPCLVSYAGGNIVGFTLWTGMNAGPIELRERACAAILTDADAALRTHAFELAWAAGYTRVDGMAFGKQQLATWTAHGATVPRVIVHVNKPATGSERKVA